MWKVIWKNPKFRDNDYSKIVYTEVRIEKTGEKYKVITELLDGDCMNKLDEELIELVKEKNYLEEYPNRAENEKFLEFKIMMDKMKKEFDEELMKMKVAFAEFLEDNTEDVEDLEEAKEETADEVVDEENEENER